MTLHGSDLLLHATYLDTKLAECEFCVTVSEFNRQYLLAHYPTSPPTNFMCGAWAWQSRRAFRQLRHRPPPQNVLSCCWQSADFIQ